MMGAEKTGSAGAPTAVADSAATVEDTAIDIAVLANDTDPDTSNTLSVSAPTGPCAFDATSALGASVTLNATTRLPRPPSKP